MSKMQFNTGVVVCATIAAGLCLTGCRTIHSSKGGHRSSSSAAPTPAEQSADNDVRPMPPVLDAAPVRAAVREPAPAKETPWYVTHGEVSAASHSGARAAGSSAGSYTVQKGDIAGRIAQRHGVTLAELKAANPGKDLNKLKIGQKLVIPAKSSKQPKRAASSSSGKHVVQKGEILGRIARQYGVKVSDLKAANGLTSDTIKVGQELVIPGKGAKSTPAKTDAPKTDAAKPTATKTVPAEVPPTPPAPVVDVVPPAPQPPVVKPEVKPADNSAVFEVKPVEIPAPAPVVTPPPAVPPAPAPVAAEASSGQTHTVMQGEDVYVIAIRWGVSPQELKRLNNLTSDTIPVGTVLKIPGAN